MDCEASYEQLKKRFFQIADKNRFLTDIINKYEKQNEYLKYQLQKHNQQSHQSSSYIQYTQLKKRYDQRSKEYYNLLKKYRDMEAQIIKFASIQQKIDSLVQDTNAKQNDLDKLKKYKRQADKKLEANTFQTNSLKQQLQSYKSIYSTLQLQLQQTKHFYTQSMDDLSLRLKQKQLYCEELMQELNKRKDKVTPSIVQQNEQLKQELSDLSTKVKYLQKLQSLKQYKDQLKNQNDIDRLIELEHDLEYLIQQNELLKKQVENKGNHADYSNKQVGQILMKKMNHFIEQQKCHYQQKIINLFNRVVYLQKKCQFDDR